MTKMVTLFVVYEPYHHSILNSVTESTLFAMLSSIGISFFVLLFSIRLRISWVIQEFFFRTSLFSFRYVSLMFSIAVWKYFSCSSISVFATKYFYFQVYNLLGCCLNWVFRTIRFWHSAYISTTSPHSFRSPKTINIPKQWNIKRVYFSNWWHRYSWWNWRKKKQLIKVFVLIWYQ